MKKIKTTNQFEKDLKSIGLTSELIEVLYFLTQGLPVPKKYNDHSLKGNLKNYRECHLKPDLLLAYQIVDDYINLISVDNHNNLFKLLKNRK